MKKILIMLMLAVLMGCQAERPQDIQGQVANIQTIPDQSTQSAQTTQPSLPMTYRVVTTGEQPPFSYRDERGNLIGIDIDVIRAIGEVQGFEVAFDTRPWSEVLASVADGQNDLAISGVSYSDERHEKYTLSKRYLYVPSAIMVTDPNIKSLQDLSGKRFGCMTGAKQCDDIVKAVPNATIVEDDTTFLTFASLAQGKNDAIGEDMQLLEFFAKKHPTLKTNIIAYETESDPQSAQVVVVAKGQEQLVALINEGIDKLIANGKIAEIERKWLDNPY